MHGESLCSNYFQRQASSLVGERRVDEWGDGRKEVDGVCAMYDGTRDGGREAYGGVDRRCCIGCNARGEGARG